MKPAQPSGSRRQFLQTGAAIAATSVVAAAQSAGREAVEAGLAPLTLDPNRRLLLKGGTIVSLDPSVGDFVQGDILIQGNKIAAVGANVKLSGPAPRIIDASNTILIPGFIDCHRHSWEGVLRRIIPNGDIAKYMATTHQGFAPYYRPHDVYVGNLVTALGCIDAGMTCVIDNSHNSRSSAHSDAAVQALFDSGIRAVHASGAPQNGDWDHQWPQDLERLQKRFFSSGDQLVTLRPRKLCHRAETRVAHYDRIARCCRSHAARAVLEREAPRSRHYLQPLWRSHGFGVAKNSRIGRHCRCHSTIRSAVWVG